MSIFLVRHAKAANREKWTGPDELRSLSTSGRQQAETIARRVGEFPVTRLLSSPSLRCVQTLELLAVKVGVAVERVPALGEGQPFAPVIDLLTELPDYSVLCSHGDVLPDTIAALERRDMVVQGPPDWRKGVVWEIDRVNGVFLRARALAPER
jgi:phosphohistidine phosphatase SixA